MVKRLLRLSAGAIFTGYLVLGGGLYRLEATKPRPTELPMARWSISEIEAQSRRALHVVAQPGTAPPKTAPPKTAQPKILQPKAVQPRPDQPNRVRRGAA